MSFASSADAAPPSLHAEHQRERAVLARVGEINTRLGTVVEQWDGARVQLANVQHNIRANEHVLHIARRNLSVAQQRLKQRLVRLYVDPAPGSLAVIAGASSISDAINRLDSLRLVATQDAAIAREAGHLTRQVQLRERALQRERRQSLETVRRLADERATINRQLAEERRLLASIHQSIQTLVAQAAARERARAAAARARVAREVAAAKRRAAAEAIAATANPVITPPAEEQQPAPQPQPQPAPAPAPPPAPAPAPAPLPTPAPPPPAGPHSDAATIAARYLGVPYVWGGSTPSGFDCSGLVSYVYAQLGIALPHYTVAQWDATTPIATSQLEPGDLVFFDHLGHVGIYIGGGQFIHAPHTGTVVQIAALSGYWAANLDGARRVP